eukprot:595568-Prymnesium_polylepis.1
MLSLLSAARATTAAPMREVFIDVFRTVATAGRLMRTAGGGVPDWEAKVVAARSHSLGPVLTREA